jgi:hypothetical protein
MTIKKSLKQCSTTVIEKSTAIVLGEEMKWFNKQTITIIFNVMEQVVDKLRIEHEKNCVWREK